MKKVIRTILILLAVFVGSTIVFAIQLNRNTTTVLMEAAEDPTLPVVNMVVNDTDVNEMYGIRQELNEQMLRDSVTPLPADKTLSLKVVSYDNEISGISYQITLPEDGSLVENGQVIGADNGDGILTGSFTVNSNLRNSQEYTLRITLDIGEDDHIYYYTRLTQGSGIDFSDYFVFAQSFANTCLNKTEADALTEYLESDDTAANRSYTDVNINSSTDMVTWGNLDPTLVKRAVPKILELNTSTASIQLEYLISAEDSNEETEYYKVNDFYRLKYNESDGSISLLNFERSATLIFDVREAIQTTSGLDLGVQERDLTYAGNDDQDIAAFVIDGELWTYNQNSGVICRVFSFRSYDDASDSSEAAENITDSRTLWTDHDIKIESVSETGDVTFVVYGYMATGAHEGENGVAVYQYSVDTNSSQEQIFIPMEEGFSYLSENAEQLSYVSSENELYLFLGTELCRINLTNGSYEIIQEGILSGGFSASESQETVAWVSGEDLASASGATIMNLETGETTTVSAPTGETIVICGFVKEDFVYGYAKTEDIVTDTSGNTTYGIYELFIQDMDGTVKKTYQPEGQYITSVKQEDNGLEVVLSTKNDGTYTASGTDHLVSGSDSDTEISLSYTVYERTGEKTLLNFPTAVSVPTLSSVYASLLDTTVGSETIIDWPEQEPGGYYVYGEGKMIGRYEVTSQAIGQANDVSGVVLNSSQQYVWVRGDWGTSYTIDSAALPDGLIGASYDTEALASLLGDSYDVINMEGCDQDCLKYMISRGYAVLAKVSDSENWLLVGYDAYNFWYWDASEGEAVAVASDDSAELFEKQGNQFLSYMAK